jgi:predicted nucleotidyltransferase
MTLLGDVVAVLERAKIDHALIGAAAMAVHGVSRATADVDLFTVDEGALRQELWKELEREGDEIRLLRGDFEDPLAGSVRLSRGRDEMVDVVIGRYRWQAEIVESSVPMSIGGVTVKVAGPAGLVLLKLYAGGPKDAWDIHALLESHDLSGDIKSEVSRAVSQLPVESRQLWARLLEGI